MNQELVRQLVREWLNELFDEPKTAGYYKPRHGGYTGPGLNQASDNHSYVEDGSWNPTGLSSLSVFGNVSRARDGKTGYKVQPTDSVAAELKQFFEESGATKDEIVELGQKVKTKIDAIFTSALKAIPDLDPAKWDGPKIRGKDEITGAVGYRYDHPGLSAPFMVSLHGITSARGNTTERTQNVAGYCMNIALTAPPPQGPGLKVKDFTQIAKKGSTVPDVKFNFENSEPIIVEVKQDNAYLFDKTMSRDGVTSKKAARAGSMIDKMAVALAKSVAGVSSSFPRGSIASLADYVDALRADPVVKKAVSKGAPMPGYAGDGGGTAAKGSLPAAYFSLPDSSKGFLVQVLQEHWVEGGDNYLAVVSGNQSYVWFTGNGKNLLESMGVKSFGPESFTSARLRNGSAGEGKIRVMVDVKFNLTDGFEVCAGKGAFMNEALVRESRDIQRLRSVIRESLLMEELTRSDKVEVGRIIRKEIDKDRAKQKKVARTEAEEEIKKALGVSFFGSKGKINKFVVDAIHSEVTKLINKGQTRDDIAKITKDVIKKLYKELAVAQAPVIDRIKV